MTGRRAALGLFSLVALCLALSSCADGGFDGPARRFSGVWLYEFEGSTFVEGATGIPAARPDYRKTDWLERGEWPQLEALLDRSPADGRCHRVEPFLVVFEGRRTHYPVGGAGHLGLWRSKVTVHRPISARRLGPSFCYDR